MYMTKTYDLINFILITTSPYIPLIVRTKLYHSEWHSWSGKLHPSRIRISNHRINVLCDIP